MRRLGLTLALMLLLATPAWAQRERGTNSPAEATPIRCVNIAGTAFEACGGGAGGGVTDTDDNSIAFAQTPGLSIALNYVSNGAVWARLVFGQAAMAASLPVTIASDQSALHTICDSGCAAPAATADGTAFTFGTTNVSPVAFVVDDVASTTVAENAYGAARMTGSRILYIDLSKTAANATKLLVTPDSVALPANQSVNVAQLAGTTTDTNSGTKSAGTLRVVLATDQPALTNKLLVTPDSVALPANQSVNVAQLAGTTTDTNSGTKSAGTLRVVLATDQPALSNKLLVTPDSVALPANQSVNVAQLAGTATDTNSGSKSAGTLRVVLATDQPQLTAKLLVTPDSVALPANQSVNVAQMNGVATTMGAGATGTGVQRVNDVASSATGAAPPASAIYNAGLGSGATGGFLTGVSVGDTNKVVNVSTATTTLMVTGVSGRQVHITAFHLMTNAANSVAWLEGTGATCGTGTAGMAGGTTAASGYNFAANGGIAMGSGYGDVLATATTGDSVCIITSAATQLSGFIKYTIY